MEARPVRFLRCAAAIVMALAAPIAACTLTTSLDGLSGGADLSADAGNEAGGSDAPDGRVAVTTDAGEAGGGTDAGAAGLVGYWSFDEGTGSVAHDSSGYGNDGILQGGTAWGTGRIGHAVSFDGVSGYVLVGAGTGSSAVLDLTTTLTIALWVNVDDVTVDNMRVISKNDAYDIKLNGRSPQWSCASGYAEVNASVAPNTWHHIAVTFDTGSVRTYLDGVAQAIVANTVAEAANPAGTTLRFGAYEETNAYFTKGLLDEIRIYNRVLAASEITALAGP
jgi:hypothetical protein